MKLIPYLMFREGKCREVFALHAKALGGEVRMRLAESQWAPRFGMVDDRYGQPWMVNCMKPSP